MELWSKGGMEIEENPIDLEPVQSIDMVRDNWLSSGYPGQY